jgi:hypothetical protein
MTAGTWGGSCWRCTAWDGPSTRSGAPRPSPDPRKGTAARAGPDPNRSTSARS